MKKTLLIALLYAPLMAIAQQNSPVIVLDGVALDTKYEYHTLDQVEPGILRSLVEPNDIESIDVLKGTAAIEKYGEFLGKNGIVVIKRKNPSKSNIPYDLILSYGDGQPLAILDGEVIDNDEIKNISPDEIESIEVIKNDINYVKKFGPKSLNGIIKITMKK